MKKTLTVNLGGTVFHIDEDAYRLLDEYLSNLSTYFRKEEGGNEIIKDIEVRISELFTEKICTGYQVITIEDVQEVISRIGRPEEISDSGSDESTETEDQKKDFHTYDSFESTSKKFYRNPDDKIFGGVASGLAAYMGWNTTVVRLILILLFFFTKSGVGLVYLICWLLIPEAKTITEKLAMHGKKISMENIGKTVTEGFYKVSEGVNKTFEDAKQKGTLQKIGEVLVAVTGMIMKIGFIILAVILSPVLVVVAILLFAFIIVAMSLAIGGGSMLYTYLPSADWSLFINSPFEMLTMSFAGLLLIGIPLVGLIYLILGTAFNWKPMGQGVKITLIVLWIISLIACILLYGYTGVLPNIPINI